MNTPLRATYRLQLRSGVTLRDARALLPQLDALGASHLYLSPVLLAREGSAHGYDVTDPTRLDPALGSERDLEKLAAALRARKMGLVLDIVPNHLAADPQNPFFDDLLRSGPQSAHAAWFDVDWGRGRRRPLLLPVLGRPLEACLAAGEISLRRERGEMRVGYFERSFPLASPPEAMPRGPVELRRLLSRQHYRLAFWRDARHRLNYRRFFDVNELIGVRVEEPAVFDATHAKILEWIGRGLVQGLRVDHVDGLRDPLAYLRRLRRCVDARAGGARIPIWTEKILGPDEELPAAWPVEGTTGYEFANQMETALLDPGGVAEIERGFVRLTGAPRDFEAVARDAKRMVLRELLRADLVRLARDLALETGTDARDVATALVEVIAPLPVYRVYPDARGLASPERRRLEKAFAAARKTGRAPAAALSALAKVLLPVRFDAERLALAQRFQQLAAPAAAKGVEDTALYRHVALTSRNEVGGEPGPLPRSPLRALHGALRVRARRHPAMLLSVTTHDTKRSADLRARLDVLAEVPRAWQETVARWRGINAPLRRQVGGSRVLDAATEVLLYQTLVGVWPLSPRGGVPARAERVALEARVAAYMEKATREAKQRTSWIRPNVRFERALAQFVHGLFAGSRGPDDFLRELSDFAAELARPGLWNALSRTLFQLTAPGVPDVYRGDELWRFSLVDPDNRRDVDFAARRRLLRQVTSEFARGGAARERLLRALVAAPEGGRIKLHVIRAALAARRRHPEIFAGTYEPLRARGPRAGHVMAFLRRAKGGVALVAAPRLPRTLVGDSGDAPVGPGIWDGTVVALPADAAGRRFASWLNGRRQTASAVLPAARLFAELPVALWVAGPRR